MLSPLISLSLSNEGAFHPLVIASPAIVALRIAIVRAEEWPRGKAPEGSTVTCHSRTVLRSLETLSAAEIRMDRPDVDQSGTTPEMVVMMNVSLYSAMLMEEARESGRSKRST